MLYSRTKNLSGQKFGRLTAISPNGKQGKAVMWLCRCECGNDATVRGGNLTSKTNPTVSCGCALGYEDLTGRRFGRWEVIERNGSNRTRNSAWSCSCDCGNSGTVSADNLRGGQSKSCGCLIGERHGMAQTPEYRAWVAMIQRCHNPKMPNFKDYGGRGIVVCDEWRGSFTAFYEHIGPKPSSDLSIDRIENNGNYEPGNVRWATRLQQNNNTRKTAKRKTPQQIREDVMRISKEYQESHPIRL